MKRTLIAGLILILGVTFALTWSGKPGRRTAALVPTAKCSTTQDSCTTWCQNCRDAARSQYNSCIASQIPQGTCEQWQVQTIVDCYAGLPCTCASDGAEIYGRGNCFDARVGTRVPCP